MSFERARAPMMSDAINFHNEDRTRHRHPFAPQPSTSMMGLPQSYSIYEKPTLELNTPKAKTKLIAESQGFSHTSSLGVHYVPPCIDPRYSLPKFGNERPQVLNYYRRTTNLLFK